MLAKRPEPVDRALVPRQVSTWTTFNPGNFFKEVRAVLLDDEHIDARDLLWKLVQLAQAFPEVGDFLLTDSSGLLSLGKAIHVYFKVGGVAVLQEVMGCRNGRLLVMAWQPSLKKKEAEEVELVAWADLALLDQVHKLLVAVETVVFVYGFVTGHIRWHGVGTIAKLKRQWTTLRVIRWNNVAHQKHYMACQGLLFLEYFLKEGLLYLQKLFSDFFL